MNTKRGQPPKSEQKTPEFGFTSPQKPSEKIEPLKLPLHLECKVFLKEIKLLIDHVVKNTENSLISSIMETIPKLIERPQHFQMYCM